MSTIINKTDAQGNQLTAVSDASGNAITNSTAGADGNSNTSNRIPVNARLEGFNGTTWDRLKSGITGAITSITGFLNTIPVGEYNSSAPTLTSGQHAPLQVDSNGRLITTLGTSLSSSTDSIESNHYQSAPSQSAISVTTTSTSVLAANTNRKSVTLINDSANTIYVSLNGAAALNQGIRLNANGGSIIYDRWVPTGAITAISSATSNLLVVEG